VRSRSTIENGGKNGKYPALSTHLWKERNGKKNVSTQDWLKSNGGELQGGGETEAASRSNSWILKAKEGAS